MDDFHDQILNQNIRPIFRWTKISSPLVPDGARVNYGDLWGGLDSVIDNFRLI